jgi:hypothetical protein
MSTDNLASSCSILNMESSALPRWRLIGVLNQLWVEDLEIFAEDADCNAELVRGARVFTAMDCGMLCDSQCLDDPTTRNP